MKKSEICNKKFIKTWKITDYEIETDEGFVEIVNLHKTVPYSKFIIKTEDGLYLECADKHILFKNGFEEIFADELKEGDNIITKNGLSKVVKIENTNEKENMYDFELSEASNHRYYTNDILSHNTLLVKTIAKLLNVPCYIQDCTKITASGYVGSDVEDCLVGLLRSCNYNMQAAEMGIVMLDEGDKIAKKESGVSVVRDVSGECVQQSLLKIVEGDVVGIPPMGGRKHPEQPLLYINTKNILFILSGAFVGLDEIISKRMGNGRIGFSTEEREVIDEKNCVEYATPQDLREFGFIPEFIGRFPIITHVNPLSEESLVTILKEPKNALVKQYTELLAMDNVKLIFEEDALREIARIAINLETGARGLKTILETVMTDIMYDAPLKAKKSKNEIYEIVITSEMVKEKTETKFKNMRKAI